jgi:membrane associated rhomboid family serine protease
MLEDRHYMRRPSFRSGRSATVTLLIVNVVAFLVQSIHYGYPPVLPEGGYFALSAEGLRHGYLWQLLTFQFMHGGLLHLLLNCWAIYIFGREVEEAFGQKSFLTLYFSSGIIGGIFQALAGLLPGGNFAGPVVGASAGAFGLVAAFAMLYPERPLTLLLFFIIPVNMRAKFLLLFSALIALFGLAFRTGNIAHAAHLGGMLTGVVFVRYAIHWNLRWPRFVKKSGPPARPLVRVHSQKSALWGNKTAVPEDLPAEEFLSKEVDPILEKISAHGIQSLTERERRVLESARARMAKR